MFAEGSRGISRKLVRSLASAGLLALLLLAAAAPASSGPTEEPGAPAPTGTLQRLLDEARSLEQAGTLTEARARYSEALAIASAAAPGSREHVRALAGLGRVAFAEQDFQSVVT